MDIRCERCGTEYELDEDRIPDAGVNVKCTTCSHTFRVFRGMGSAAAAPGFKLRRGGVNLDATCPDLATLQRWVIERRVLRDDETSQSGGAWRRLSELPELAPFFDIVGAAPQPARAQTQPPHVPPAAAAGQTVSFFAPNLNPPPHASQANPGAGQTAAFFAPNLNPPPHATQDNPGAGQTAAFFAPNLNPPPQSTQANPGAGQTAAFFAPNLNPPPHASQANPGAGQTAAFFAPNLNPPPHASQANPGAGQTAAFFAPNLNPPPHASQDNPGAGQTAAFFAPNLNPPPQSTQANPGAGQTAAFFAPNLNPPPQSTQANPGAGQTAAFFAPNLSVQPPATQPSAASGQTMSFFAGAPAAPSHASQPSPGAGQTAAFFAPNLNVPSQPTQPPPDAGQTAAFFVGGVGAASLSAPFAGGASSTSPGHAPVAPAAPAVPDAASTMQFRVATVPEGHGAGQTATMRLPSLEAARSGAGSTTGSSAPAAAPVPDAASTLQFRVPATAAPAADRTESLNLNQLQKQGLAAPSSHDAATEMAIPRLSMPAPKTVSGLASAEGTPPERPSLRQAAQPSRESTNPDVPSKVSPESVTEPPEPRGKSTTHADERPLPKPLMGDRDDELPRSRRQPSPAAERPDEDEGEDPVIAAFQARARRNRNMGIGVGVALVLGVGGYAGYHFLLQKPEVPAVAKKAFEAGRAEYLSDVVGRFGEAHKKFAEARAAAKDVPFPEVEAAEAELHANAAEKFLEEAVTAEAEASTYERAGDTDMPAKLRAAAEKARAGAKQNLDDATQNLTLANSLAPEAPATHRAALDYYRVAGDVAQADVHAKALGPLLAADPEAKAHVAALWVTQPAQASAAESMLAEVVKARPDFRRARYWLAQAKLRRSDVSGALSVMEALLAAEPTHERAQAFIEANRPKPPPEPVVDAADAGTPPAVEPAKPVEPAKAVEPAKPVEPVKVVEPVKPAEPAKPVAAAVDVDKLISQGNTLLEKGQAAKALDAFTKAVEAKPENAEAHTGRGWALFDLSRLGDAVGAFNAALKANPKYSDAMIGLAEAFKSQGKNKDAVRWYQEYLKVSPAGEDAETARLNIQALK